jgi:hypothetical protein
MMGARMNSARWWLVTVSLGLVGCAASCGSAAPETPAATGGQTSAIAHTSEIAGASTTCSQFAAGTAPALRQVRYSIKGHSISAVDPNAFVYWVKLTRSKSGFTTVTITQSANAVSRPLFAINGGVFDKFSVGARTCQPISGTIGQVNPVKVNFTARAGATYYISVKFSVLAVIGQPVPPGETIKLVFSISGVNGSTSEVDLVKT